MGCHSSKPAAHAEPAEPAATLLAADFKEAQSREVCKSCGDTGKDIMGKRCTCPLGQSILGPKVVINVNIVSARGLRDADFNGKSDPYCACEVAGKSGSGFETKVIDGQLNPEWNHLGQVLDCCVGEALSFTVKNKDPSKPDDVLGKATLTTKQFLEDGFDGELELAHAGKGVQAYLKVKVTVVQPLIWVTLLSAKNLRNADFVGKSDPYCICEIPGRPGSKIETTAINEQLSPEWNHEAQVIGYKVEDSLTFTVRDKDPIKPDDVLGSATLTTEQFLDAGFDGELKLSNAGDGVEAFLQIKITVGEKAAEEEVAEQTEVPADVETKVAPQTGPWCC